MDNQKICKCVRSCSLVLLVALLWVGPVFADPPVNDEWRVNSQSVIESGELPAPLPRLPDPVQLNPLVLPYVDHSAWPTTVDEREATKILMQNRVLRVQNSLNAQYSAARSQVAAVRETTAQIQAMVGNPMEVVSTIDERSVTATAMAQEMAQSVSFALGYARAVSSIGPLGLDLVFLFIGLGWLLFVNLITMLIHIVAWFVRMAGKVIQGIYWITLLILELIRVIIALVDLLWPF